MTNEDPTINYEDKDFTLLGNVELVHWWNRHVDQAQALHLTSYKNIQKFENHDIAVKRCSMMASSLRAAIQGDKEVKTATAPAVAEEVKTATAPAVAEQTTGETDMAKKAKKAKTKKEKTPRQIGKPPKAAAELKTVRGGTDRAEVLKLCGGSRTVDEVAKEMKMKPGYILQHLYCAWRDVGVGYEVAPNGKVKVLLPGSKTIRDIIVEKKEA